MKKTPLSKALATALCVLCLAAPLAGAAPGEMEEPTESPETTELPDEQEPEASPDIDGPEETPPEDGELPDDGLQADEPDEEEGRRAVVTTTRELADALGSAAVTEVFLGADIAVDQPNITISPAKDSLVISGKNPDTGHIHTLTDYPGTDIHMSLSLRQNGNLTSITLEDIRLVGLNHYTPIAIYDECKNIETIYRRVDYRGPQLIYNRNGQSRIEQCDIEIGKYTGTADAGEVGEVGGVTLAGAVNIVQATGQANEIFYFPLRSGSVAVEPGANVSVSTATESGFLYAGHQVSMTIGTGAVFSYTGPQRFWENIALQSLTVAENARCLIRITGTAVNAPLRVENTLSVASGGWLHVIQDRSSGYPSLAVQTAVFSDPASVLLYSPGRRTIQATTGGATVDITARQLNYWTAAGPGGLNDPPLYHWRGEEETLTLNSTLPAGADDNWSLTSQLAQGDEELSSATCNIVRSRVLAFGRLELTAQYISPDDGYAAVSGMTGGGTELLVEYTDRSGEDATATALADPGGGYTVVLTHNPPLAHSALTVHGVWNYLRAEQVVGAAPQLLTFVEVPEILAFNTASPSAGTQTVLRRDPEWAMTVFDSRGEGSAWTIHAKLLGGFYAQALQAELRGTLRFIDADGDLHELAVGQEVLIAEHRTRSDQDTHVVSWAEGRGVVLHLAPGAGLTGAVYTAEIQWLLSNAP